MEQQTPPSGKREYPPILLATYHFFKKAVKYSIYIMILYFACAGFMAWD